MVKWLSIVLIGVLCSWNLARGDAAGDLVNQGSNAMGGGDYAAAAKAFDQVLTQYPNTSGIDDIRLRAGYAHMLAAQYPEAVDRLAPLTAKTVKAEVRSLALYFTGLTQLSQAGTLSDTAAKNGAYGKAIATLGDLIALIGATHPPDTDDMLEDSYYNRAIGYFQKGDYDNAEKDLLTLRQQYTGSLRRADYLVLLGTLYAVETNLAVQARKTNAEIEAQANKAIDTFGEVGADPNALIQANEADADQAKVLYLLAQLREDGADKGAINVQGYGKALEAFRKIKRKDDLIPQQEERLKQLQARAQAQLSQSNGGSLTNTISLIINRERIRLETLKNEPDPIIDALIGIAECYNAMHQYDEARTVLHRLAHTTLSDDQQKQVDFQSLYSYVLAGKRAEADQALTDFLGKHPGDTSAESLSYLLGATLAKTKDYTGALAEAERSLKDFPNGAYAGNALELKAQALNALGRADEAQEALRQAASRPSVGGNALQGQISLGQSLLSQGKFDDALKAFQQVRDNPAAGELQPIAGVYYIQTLQSLSRFDDVIREAKAFAAKYPASPQLGSVLVLSAIAMDQKHDPGAAAVLQDVAKRFPKDDATAFGLYYLVTLYQRAGKTAEMSAAARQLRETAPTAYTYLAQAADAVSAVEVKAKKFDDAIAEYQPLLDAPKPEVAADASNKTGGIWLAAAKAMGSYQSLQNEQDKTEAQARLDKAAQAYVATLQKYPDQLDAVGAAFDGLNDLLIQRRSSGLLADADFEGWLDKQGAALADPAMKARLELAKAAVVFLQKGGDKQYPAALDRFKKVVDANPSLKLTDQEASQFGRLLLAGGDSARALQVYTALQAGAAPTDNLAQGDAAYGLGAAYLAQGDLDQAKSYFEKMKALPGGGAWHPRYLDATYGLASIAEQRGDGATAKPLYAAIMRSPQASPELQAKAMLGFGHVLEKEGHAVQAPGQQDIDFAVHYYRQIHVFFGMAVPQLSAQGLYEAVRADVAAGDKADAARQLDDLRKYAEVAPEWVAKGLAALKP